MSKIVCSVCGSDDVQAKVWVKLNENYETTTEFIDEMIREPGLLVLQLRGKSKADYYRGREKTT